VLRCCQWTLPAVVGVCVAATMLAPRQAQAVPSLARQMGVACQTCHTAFPELTPFGRQFKAAGYVQTTEDQITQKDGRDWLSIAKSPPISFMLLGSYTARHEKEPDTVNSDVLVPDQLSLFYAGRIAPLAGGFFQVTYDPQADHFSIDNLDLRVAGTVAGDFVVGGTVNNNPTSSDLWNAAPAWGWPWAVSGAWPGLGSNSAVVDGALAQAAVGVGPYVFWKKAVYLEADVYRSAPLGVARPLAFADNSNIIHAVAPYWRAAWQGEWGEHSAEVGTFGMVADLYPGAAAGLPLSGSTDEFVDVAADAQYQYIEPNWNAALHAVYIYEQRHLRASADGAKPHLNTLRAEGQAYWGLIGASAGYFDKWGSTSDSWGTESGLPDTRGMIFELTLRPWLNFYLRAQYTLYFTFDGRKDNFDGQGRNASANNTFAALAWLAY
jgi:hypothetical protein